jgi:cytoskeleton protein RodZ
VTAPTPLAVVIGRADATEVVVKGKPFDLVPVTRENVARFEVK